jgi:tRNA pseudouridine13 synthase
VTAEGADLGAALTPPHAHGVPDLEARLRVQPEDFEVQEELGFMPAGSGAHLLLQVRKVNANTQHVARQLARFSGCRVGDVGYAGLKDRRAVAVQWFSVPRPRQERDWSVVGSPEFTVLSCAAHTRKLPRGALAGNRFAIRLRSAEPALSGAALAAQLAPRLALLGSRGVPNYFGPQRFGRAGANLARIDTPFAELARAERGFVLSAARALIFNAVLARRVQAHSWGQLQRGDVVNLDGRGSVFALEQDPDESLRQRCEALQVHPTGPLWGRGTPLSAAAVAQLEAQVADTYPPAAQLCVQPGMRAERRSLRLAVYELRTEAEPAALRLHFRLPRGAFATAVLRELVRSPAELPEE